MPSEDRKPHTLSEIKQACQLRFGHDGQLIEVCRVSEELIQGIDKITPFDRLATLYGSARFTPEHDMYQKAEKIAQRLVKEANFSIITGGSHGIMEASNKGAFEAKGDSLGATIVLPNEQTTNKYLTLEIPFEYFFTRKTVLRYATELAIFFPGGYGTFDELFDLLALVQTGKIKHIPIILFGTSFWNPLVEFIQTQMVENWKTIGEQESKLFVVTDSIDEIIQIANDKTFHVPGSISVE